MAEFICNLKKYRLLKDLTQEQLAEKVGVRRETIMRLEAGKYNPCFQPSIYPGWWKHPLRNCLSLIKRSPV